MIRYGGAPTLPPREATQLEQLCDDLARAENVDILCVYPLPPRQDEILVLDRIFAQHSVVSYR
jgi:hypothetical protein